MSGGLMTFNITQGFAGDVVGPISTEKAVRRVLAYCTTPTSGWGVYDLMGIHARRTSRFDAIDATTLLLAIALNGQVSLANLADFNLERRRELAERLARVPDESDLANLDGAGLGCVVDLCSFGYPGVWGPKITKVCTLLRPGSVPVLDGYVALAFGFGREAFSAAARQRGLNRRERIDTVIQRLAIWLRDNRDVVTYLRAETEPAVPELRLIPDLRLMDLVLWTSQDDKMPRRARQGPRWQDRSMGSRIPLADLAPVPLS